jgi:hypothetical protein
MSEYLEALERAFQIARSGSLNSVDDLRKTRKWEQYDTHALEGCSLTRQLLQLSEKRSRGRLSRRFRASAAGCDRSPPDGATETTGWLPREGQNGVI